MNIEQYLAARSIHPDPDYSKKDDTLRYLCPLHRETKPSFEVTGDNWENWHCWGCGKRGSLQMLITLMEGVSMYEAYEISGQQRLREEWSTKTVKEKTERERRRNKPATEEQQEVMTVAARWWHTLLHESPSSQVQQAILYAIKCGAIPSVLKLSYFGYAPGDPDKSYASALAHYLTRQLGTRWHDHAPLVSLFFEEGRWYSRTHYRLLFFSRDVETGNVMYYQGRIIEPYTNKIPYWGPKGISKYPFYIPVKDPQIDATIGTESPKGPMAAAGYGLPCFATLGNGSTIEESFLNSVAHPILWAQDNDEPHAKLRKDGSPMLDKETDEPLYEQPGEIQAQKCLELCQKYHIEACRLEPPREVKGLNDWIAASQSATPILKKMWELGCSDRIATTSLSLPF